MDETLKIDYYITSREDSKPWRIDPGMIPVGDEWQQLLCTATKNPRSIDFIKENEGNGMKILTFWIRAMINIKLGQVT